MKNARQWLQKLSRVFSTSPAEGSTNHLLNAAETKRLRDNASYWADQPISSREDDKFNRWPFAQRIADTVARRRDTSSLVLGIYGVWGDGKSSTLQLLEEAAKAYDDIILVRFNPWHFQSEAQLLRGFFKTLADALERSLSTKIEGLGEILSRYGSLLSLASIGVAGGVVQISPGTGAREFGQALSTVELDELRTRVERILSETQKRIVVLIDDIDRLDRQEIQAIFKLVKLSAGFLYTIYILAFDDEVVADALGEKYGAGGPEAGRNFLEKIVQVPLHLPPANRSALRHLAFEGVDSALKLSDIELTEEQVHAFVRHFVDGLEIQLITPRQARRYANALMFALPILKGEVHPVDQLLVEGIRTFYPKLYVTIRENPDVFVLSASFHRSTSDATRQRTKEVINAGLGGLTPSEQQAAEDLLQVLFPRLKGVFGNTEYGTDWDEIWTREQRICSDEYFHRYFQYAVPTGDVPDQAMESFLKSIKASDEASIGNAIRDLSDNGAAAERLVHKLRLQEESVLPLVAEKLALAVARNGAAFPKNQSGPFNQFTSPFYQAAILVAQLCRRVPAGATRDELARNIAKDAIPLPFALECFQCLRADKDESTSERILTTAVEQEIGKIVADRVRAAAEEQALYITFQDDAAALFWVWNEYGTPGEVDTHLSARFDTDPYEVLKFLSTYVGTAWGLESGLPHKSNFERRNYDAITKCIDPEKIFTYLKSLYGASLDAPTYHHSRDFPLEERIAQQFAFIHKKVQESPSP